MPQAVLAAAMSPCSMYALELTYILFPSSEQPPDRSLISLG